MSRGAAEDVEKRSKPQPPRLRACVSPFFFFLGFEIVSKQNFHPVRRGFLPRTAYCVPRTTKCHPPRAPTYRPPPTAYHLLPPPQPLVVAHRRFLAYPKPKTRPCPKLTFRIRIQELSSY